MRRTDFVSDQFGNFMILYKLIGDNLNVMRESACLVFNPITDNNHASLFNCTPLGQASDDGPDLNLFILIGWGWSDFVCCVVHRGSTCDSRLLKIFSGVV